MSKSNDKSNEGLSQGRQIENPNIKIQMTNQYRNSNFKLKLMVFISIIFLGTIPSVVKAFWLDEIFDEFKEWFSEENNNSQIINQVNVSTNTGNNVINGEIKEGEAKTSIEVKNIVNGKEIEPIEIKSGANQVKVESEIRVEKGSDKAVVQRKVEIDSEKTEENYEVDLKTSEEKEGGEKLRESGLEGEESGDEELKKERSGFQEWWSDVIKNLKSFFQNIFNIF